MISSHSQVCLTALQEHRCHLTALHAVLQVSFPCTGCSSCGYRTAINGSLSDRRDGNTQFLHSARCKWIIAPPNATQIEIAFTFLCMDTWYDHITVSQCSDASCETVLQLAKIMFTTTACSVNKQTYLSATGFMQVEIYLSNDEIRYGFNATWTSWGPPVLLVRVSCFLTLEMCLCAFHMFLCRCSCKHKCMQVHICN